MIWNSKIFQNAPNKNFHFFVQLLSDMEKKWVDTQKQCQTAKILEKIEKGKNQSKYTENVFSFAKVGMDQ